MGTATEKPHKKIDFVKIGLPIAVALVVASGGYVLFSDCYSTSDRGIILATLMSVLAMLLQAHIYWKQWGAMDETSRAWVVPCNVECTDVLTQGTGGQSKYATPGHVHYRLSLMNTGTIPARNVRVVLCAGVYTFYYLNNGIHHIEEFSNSKQDELAKRLTEIKKLSNAEIFYRNLKAMRSKDINECVIHEMASFYGIISSNIIFPISGQSIDRCDYNLYQNNENSDPVTFTFLLGEIIYSANSNKQGSTKFSFAIQNNKKVEEPTIQPEYNIMWVSERHASAD